MLYFSLTYHYMGRLLFLKRGSFQFSKYATFVSSFPQYPVLSKHLVFSYNESIHQYYKNAYLLRGFAYHVHPCFRNFCRASGGKGVDDISNYKESLSLSRDVSNQPDSKLHTLNTKESKKSLFGENSAVTGTQSSAHGVRKIVDKSAKFTDNVFLTPLRAVTDYCLAPSDLEKLTKYSRRSPYEGGNPITVYLSTDVQKLAMEIWGSLERLSRERDKYKEIPLNSLGFLLARESLRKSRIEEREKNIELDILFGDSNNNRSDSSQNATSASHKDTIHEEKENLKTGKVTLRNLFGSGSGRVVLYAVSINGLNFVFKLLAWIFTGSHSMFSEAIHSLADMFNQVILAVGIVSANRMPDKLHPYGYANMRHITSLISGVGIFFFGTGLSVYHGITGLISPKEMESLFWALVVLLGSFASELASFMVAFNETRESAKRSGYTVWEYVRYGKDPSVNVVLLEDAAAVTGVSIAGICLAITYHTGSPVADALGSIFIGGLLGSVAWLIIRGNVNALVGKSIPDDRKNLIQNALEEDRMIRALYDVKATEMGRDVIRFKAEVDFDGRELTRSYLDNVDLEALLEEMKQCTTVDQVENFILLHGAAIIDTLGAEVDRIEYSLKNKFPAVRHLDLEIL